MQQTILLGESPFSVKALAELSRRGRVIPFLSVKQFINNLPKADVILSALNVKLDKPLLDRAQKLKLIGSRTTQLRYIDLDECNRRKIRIINIKSSSPILKKTPSTAEETVGLIFALIRKLPWAFDSIKKEKWERMEHCGTELSGKTVGLIGFGRLGKMVSIYCRAFGAKVITHDPYLNGTDLRHCRVRKIGLNELLKTADIVSVHAIYNDSTYQLLSRKHFQQMKKSAYFINTARGEITDEKALLEALRKKWISGAAIDTLAHESPDGAHLKNNPLVNYAKKNENLIIVPHLGGTTKEAIERTQLYISDLVIREMKKQ